MLFKDLLQEVMSNRNLSLHDIETLTDVKSTKISLYLTGAEPSTKDEDKICAALNIDKDEITFDEWNISVAEASRMMGKGAEFVKQAIEKGRLPGTYTENSKGTRSFHIPRVAFMRYMQGFDEQSTAMSLLFTSIKVINGLIEETASLHSLIKMSQLYENRSDI